MARSAAEYRRTLEEPLDVGGHDSTPVRDREAPGSNPGPPNHFLIRSTPASRVSSRHLVPDIGGLQLRHGNKGTGFELVLRASGAE